MGGVPDMGAMNKQLADQEAENARLKAEQERQDKNVQQKNIDDLRRRRGRGGFASGGNNTLG